MRAIVILLAVCAAVKVWTQDRIYRSATSEAVVAAYRDRAVAACDKRSPKDIGWGSVQGKPLWSRAASTELKIGNADLGVHIWDIRNPDWDRRYRWAHLVMTMDAGTMVMRCSYDVLHDTAALTRL